MHILSNLGDIIIFSGEKQVLQNIVTSGLILDMEPYIKDKDIMRFETAIRNEQGCLAAFIKFASQSLKKEKA